jgi:hypothetical protein
MALKLPALRRFNFNCFELYEKIMIVVFFIFIISDLYKEMYTDGTFNHHN